MRRFAACCALACLTSSCRTADTAALREAQGAEPSRLATRTMAAAGGAVTLRIGEQRPTGGAIRGDLLFLHGFADRLDNHDPLFQAWTAAGFRVIAFDFPSHGETTGAGIDTFAGAGGPFRGLAALAREVEAATMEDPERPLVVAGWSTGGLLAVRALQSLSLARPLRAPRALILLAPGVAVRPLVGDFGTVTLATLTSNPSPPHHGEITPTSPVKHPAFAADLLANAALSGAEALPADIPLLVAVGGDDEDRYVRTGKVKDWARQQRAAGAVVGGLQCAGARHELDNEPDPVGAVVRAAAARFAERSLTGIVGWMAGLDLAGRCSPF